MRNSLSVEAFLATKAGYCFFFSASAKDSASSCLLTAATCTKYPPAGMGAMGSGGLAACDGCVCDALLEAPLEEDSDGAAGALDPASAVAGVSCALLSFCSTDL